MPSLLAFHSDNTNLRQVGHIVNTVFPQRDGLLELGFSKPEHNPGKNSRTVHRTITEVLSDVVGLGESNPYVTENLDINPTTKRHRESRLRNY